MCRVISKLFSEARCFFLDHKLGFLGSKGIRVERSGNIKTIIRIYECPSGERVVFLGVFHVAWRRYYRSIEKVMSKLQLKGYNVLNEGIGRVPIENQKYLTDIEKTVLKRIYSCKFSLKQSFQYL